MFPLNALDWSEGGGAGEGIGEPAPGMASNGSGEPTSLLVPLLAPEGANVDTEGAGHQLNKGSKSLQFNQCP
jgi:hypothetical protein